MLRRDDESPGTTLASLRSGDVLGRTKERRLVRGPDQGHAEACWKLGQLRLVLPGVLPPESAPSEDGHLPVAAVAFGLVRPGDVGRRPDALLMAHEKESVGGLSGGEADPG